MTPMTVEEIQRLEASGTVDPWQLVRDLVKELDSLRDPSEDEVICCEGHEFTPRASWEGDPWCGAPGCVSFSYLRIADKGAG